MTEIDEALIIDHEVLHTLQDAGINCPAVLGNFGDLMDFDLGLQMKIQTMKREPAKPFTEESCNGIKHKTSG